MTRNVRLITKLSALLFAGALAAGCEAQKSETPLSPNVAGPIAGVGISSPEPRSPVGGAEVVNTEPLRLVFTNATSNGVRPLYYSLEVATDRAFTQRVYFNPRVQPFDGAQTTVVVDVRLDAERTYYWRARAEDGANSSDYSLVAQFDIVVPVVIGAPQAASPANGQTMGTRVVELRITNGAVQGRTGSVDYRFQVATDQAFTNVVFTGANPRHASGTTNMFTHELAANTLFYWRAWGTNGVVSSPFSATRSFRTPAAPAPPPPGGGGGGGGGLPPAPGPGTRTPDPAPGQRLPLPGYGPSVVQDVAARYPNALRNSCQEHGGTWEFLDRVVDALRQYDSRWGYNWKRGNVGDPSMDVVDYHYGRGTSENSTDVYIIDIITGHCGSNPSAGWGDVTDVTINSGTIGRWTGRGRFTN